MVADGDEPHLVAPSSASRDVPDVREARGRATGSRVQGSYGRSYNRGYWLRRCEGFLVETQTKRIGHVTGIRYGETTNEPETLEVRTGLFGRTRLLISVHDITEIDPEQGVLSLADPPRAPL